MTQHRQLADQETLIDFPCDFPIKVMGRADDYFSSTIIETIRQYSPSFDASKVAMRSSSNGKYISLTCLCHVESKPQLDNIYRALTSHQLVKYVL